MWEVELTEKAIKQFFKLPRNIQENITKAIEEKLSVNPDFYLSKLSGYKESFHRLRVNDYRLLCMKRDKEKEIIIIFIGHRKDVYRAKIDQ